VARVSSVVFVRFCLAAFGTMVIVHDLHTAVRAGRGWIISRISISAIICFFPTRALGGLRDVAPGARELVEEGPRAFEACQEGTTYGECLKHTPP
jgi:hypothetical protein